MAASRTELDRFPMRAVSERSWPSPQPRREGNSVPEAGSGSVQLLTVDPDLARDLDQRRAREAAQRLYVRALEIPRGRWSPLDTVPQSSRPLGLLLLDGML